MVLSFGKCDEHHHHVNSDNNGRNADVVVSGGSPSSIAQTMVTVRPGIGYGHRLIKSPAIISLPSSTVCGSSTATAGCRGFTPSPSRRKLFPLLFGEPTRII
jgi:hypothetical protein